MQLGSQIYQIIADYTQTFRFCSWNLQPFISIIAGGHVNGIHPSDRQLTKSQQYDQTIFYFYVIILHEII